MKGSRVSILLVFSIAIAACSQETRLTKAQKSPSQSAAASTPSESAPTSTAASIAGAEVSTAQTELSSASLLVAERSSSLQHSLTSMPRSLLGISSDEQAPVTVSYYFTKISPDATEIEVKFYPPISSMTPPMTQIAPVQPDRTAYAEFRVFATADELRHCNADFVELPLRKVNGAILQTVVNVARVR